MASPRPPISTSRFLDGRRCSSRRSTSIGRSCRSTIWPIALVCRARPCTGSPSNSSPSVGWSGRPRVIGWECDCSNLPGWSPGATACVSALCRLCDGCSKRPACRCTSQSSISSRWCTSRSWPLTRFRPRRVCNACRRTAQASARRSSTVDNGDALRAQLRAVQETGIAYDREEAVLGFGCVAAPIRGAGRAIAAVSVTGRIEVIDVDPLAPIVRGAATEIWTNMFTNRPRSVTSVRARSSQDASASSLERAASAESNQWLKYDDWL